MAFRFGPISLMDPSFIYVKPGLYLWVREGEVSLVFVELIRAVPPIGRIVGEIFPTVGLIKCDSQPTPPDSKRF